jgi:hypothetical protein
MKEFMDCASAATASVIAAVDSLRWEKVFFVFATLLLYLVLQRVPPDQVEAAFGRWLPMWAAAALPWVLMDWRDRKAGPASPRNMHTGASGNGPPEGREGGRFSLPTGRARSRGGPRTAR